ncbi:MAG TPA: hypothetical protein VJ553_04805 [Candidatus Paceibacterota bacterium]|nr:hypothetical protein [Candidatus Paceibacterota bacterium]
MPDRVVAMRIGRETNVARFHLSLDDDWVTVNGIPRDHPIAIRMLTHLHLQYHILGIPHRLTLVKDKDELERIDSVSVPRILAEEWLFPRLGGLADMADEKSGIH